MLGRWQQAKSTFCSPIEYILFVACRILNHKVFPAFASSRQGEDSGHMAQGMDEPSTKFLLPSLHATPSTGMPSALGPDLMFCRTTYLQWPFSSWWGPCVRMDFNTPACKVQWQGQVWVFFIPASFPFPLCKNKSPKARGLRSYSALCASAQMPLRLQCLCNNSTLGFHLDLKCLKWRKPATDYENPLTQRTNFY